MRLLKSIQMCPSSFISRAHHMESNLFALFVCAFYRVDEACPPSPRASLPGGGGGVRGSEQRLQVKIQAFEQKMGEERGEEDEVGEDSPAPQRRYSLSQAVREERREMRFNRSVSMSHEMALLSICLDLMVTILRTKDCYHSAACWIITISSHIKKRALEPRTHCSISVY